MGLLDGLVATVAKRVERRALREAENAVTKKIKAMIFGEKEEKIVISPLVQYCRLRLRMDDLKGCHEVGGASYAQYMTIERSKAAIETIRTMRALYGKMLLVERPPFHESKMTEYEAIVTI